MFKCSENTKRIGSLELFLTEYNFIHNVQKKKSIKRGMFHETIYSFHGHK